MDKLEGLLQFIAKSEGERPGQLWPMEPQEYVVTIAPPDDENVVPALRQKIEALYPASRVLVAKFPEGRTGDKLRLLMIALLEAAGQPTPTRGESTAVLYNRVPLVLWQRADFLIVDNAHLLSLPCLHYLRRDKGIVPAVLVGRSQRLPATIEKDEMILRRSMFLQL